jgi:putative FmdB family regulatory protein
MPMYTYRREDGTTFEIRQKFLDDPLEVDPETGQKVKRIVQPSGIIFKGSGFYVTDTRGASKTTASTSSNGNGSKKDSSSGASSKESSSTAGSAAD